MVATARDAYLNTIDPKVVREKLSDLSRSLQQGAPAGKTGAGQAQAPAAPRGQEQAPSQEQGSGLGQQVSDILWGTKRRQAMVEAMAMAKQAGLQRQQTPMLPIPTVDSQVDAFKRALLQGWEEALDKVLEDNVLSEDEERRLLEMPEALGVTKDELQAIEGWQRIGKAAVLRDVLAGTIKSRITVNFALPFNLQQRETLLWLFQNVRYCESRTRTRYVGSSAGVSIRVMRGLYVRTAAFKGEPVQSTELAMVDTGLLGITDKHVYFTGTTKGLRIPYRKVASFTPYPDGIGIHRDAMTAKQQVFVTKDGWFTYNLVTNLAKLAAE